jgi:hypothetical protein
MDARIKSAHDDVEHAMNLPPINDELFIAGLDPAIHLPRKRPPVSRMRCGA